MISAALAGKDASAVVGVFTGEGSVCECLRLQCGLWSATTAYVRMQKKVDADEIIEMGTEADHYGFKLVTSSIEKKDVLKIEKAKESKLRM